MRRPILFLIAVFFLTVASHSPALAGWDPAKAEQERKAAEATIAKFKEKDPSIKRFFDNAYGYAVFPKIGKGAFIVGAAEGSGLVYEKGKIAGRAKLGQATVGLQAGGQAYSEIIFFKDKAALDTMKNNQMKLSATASAVAVTAGASAAVDYEGGVAVFTMGEAGLMLEASVGGQSFTFEPKP
jgi:lipid-binding SYLF domain-containing protein